MRRSRGLTGAGMEHPCSARQCYMKRPLKGQFIQRLFNRHFAPQVLSPF
jgi:hypothetical protein